MRLPLAALLICLTAHAASAGAILPTESGQFTFTGTLDVNPLLAEMLPGLETGDEFTGLITITAQPNGAPTN